MDKNVKARRAENKEDSTTYNLKTCTKVLRYFNQPPGECGKLFRNWKSGFTVVERLDENTYAIAHEDNKERRFIVHRDDLCPLAAVDKIHMNAQGQTANDINGPPLEQSADPVGQGSMTADLSLETADEVRRSSRLKKQNHKL